MWTPVRVFNPRSARWPAPSYMGRKHPESSRRRISYYEGAVDIPGSPWEKTKKSIKRHKRKASKRKSIFNVRPKRLFYTSEGRPHRSRGERGHETIWGFKSYGGDPLHPVSRSVKRHIKKQVKRTTVKQRIFNTRKRNQGPLTDALAGEVANRVIKFMKAAPARKRKVSSHKRKKRNPALAVIGLNPSKKRRKTMAVRRRRRNLPKRNAKGRFVRRKANPVRRKRRAVRRKRRNPVLNPRRRRHVRATPRRRRRRSNPVRTHRRRRRNPVMAHRRRRRRKNPVLNPRRRRRATTRHRRRTRRHNPVVRHRRRRNRRYTRRRNAGGIGSFIGRIDWKSVLFVSGGVFFGDKLTGIISDKIVGMTTMIPASAGPWVKVAVGVLAAGLAWKFQPALGLGIAVGATNSLLNQYVFGPAWGYVAPSLGVSGFGDYMTRSFKQDNWIGQATGANLQGMGNPLLSKGL